MTVDEKTSVEEPNDAGPETATLFEMALNRSEPLPASQVAVVNITADVLYVPLSGEALRLSPKESLIVDASAINADTLALAKGGRVVIRSLT